MTVIICRISCFTAPPLTASGGVRAEYADTVSDKPATDATPANRYPAAPEWHTVDDYFTHALVHEDDALVAARESGQHTTMANAEVAPNQGAFLALLTHLTAAKRVLEFGTLAGYSTVWFARAVGVGGQVVTLELEPQNVSVARANFTRAQVDDRITVMQGPAVDSAQQLITGNVDPFDLVFIDADKPNNPTYLQAALQLTRPGALIIIDNVVRNGEVADETSQDGSVQGVRAVVDAIAANPELTATALQTVGVKGWDGLIVARRS